MTLGLGQQCDSFATWKGVRCGEFRGLKPVVKNGVVRWYCWRHCQPEDVATNEQVVEAMGRTFRLPGNQGVLVNVHKPEACEGEGCPIHHPSDHHMKDWPLVWRGSGPFDIWAGFERQCPHGIGHLDPDTEAYMRKVGEYVPPHGCDGCCRAPEAPGLAQLDYRATPRRRVRDVLRDMLDRLLTIKAEEVS
jgi:hypothetical protein